MFLHLCIAALVFVVVLKPSSIMKHMLPIIKHVVFTNLMWVLYFITKLILAGQEKMYLE